MDGLLPHSVVDSIRRTAKSLQGYARRVFQAIVTKEHVRGNSRKAETLRLDGRTKHGYGNWVWSTMPAVRGAPRTANF